MQSQCNFPTFPSVIPVHFADADVEGMTGRASGDGKEKGEEELEASWLDHQSQLS